MQYTKILCPHSMKLGRKFIRFKTIYCPEQNTWPVIEKCFQNRLKPTTPWSRYFPFPLIAKWDTATQISSWS